MQISYDGSTAAHSLAELSAMSVGSSIGGVGSNRKAKVPAQGILRLHIIRAESLPHVHLSSTTGPYLAVRHDKMRHKTRIQNAGGVHPTWDECFDLYVNSADVRKQTVLFAVKNKKKASSSFGNGSGGSSGGNSADDDSRGIMSTISTITGGGGRGSSSVLGVANVKLVSLCARERTRTLLIPLRQVGSPKRAAGCLKVRVSFEAWNNNARRTGVGSVGAVRGTAATAAGDPSPMNLATAQHRLQNQTKKQLMAMPQQLPRQPPAMHRRPSPRQMMMGVDQRVEFGGGRVPPTRTPTPPQLPRSSGLPPRGPSSLVLGRGTGGRYHRLLEDSLEDAGANMELVGATAPAYHHRSAAKTTTNRPHCGGDNRQRPSSRNHHRRGGGGRRSDQHRWSGREHRRNRDMEERDDNAPRREDVPSMVDVVYDEVDDDHSAIDLTIDSEGGSTDYYHPRWGRARHSPASFQPHARDVIVSTSKFLCF